MSFFRTMTVAAAFTIVAGTVSAQTTVDMINPLPRSTNFFPLVVGEELGYFAAEGVEVNLLPSDTSIPYVAFIQNGQADLAMLDPFEIVNARLAGAEIKHRFRGHAERAGRHRRARCERGAIGR